MTVTAETVVSLEHAVNLPGGQRAVPALPAHALPSTPGVTVSDIVGLAEVRGFHGGRGTALWKSLLPGDLKTAEYVKLPAGCGVARQLGARAREELYLVVDGGGTATVTVGNGIEEIPVGARDLVACPVWTLHGIRAGAGGMAYLKVALRPAVDAPPRDATRVPLGSLLGCEELVWGEGEHSDVRSAADDLANLTGSWGRVTLIEVSPGATIGPHDLHYQVSALLFAVSGAAQFTAGTVTEKGGAGLFVAAPPGARCQVSNPSDTENLIVAVIEVHA
jgi:mannose-6-phosphate isomerase-like protein (cupin superfamily)